MTDKQLEYIVAIAMEGSVTKAAQNLFVSQSALSQTLAHVESEFNIQIFNRALSPLELTYEGELFVNAARNILEIKQNLIAQFKDIEHGVSGRLHIGISQSRSWLFSPLIIPDYLRRYPKVEIQFTEGHSEQLEMLLLKGKIDLVFTVQPHMNPKLRYSPLFNERMVLILPADHSVCQKYKRGDAFVFSSVNIPADLPFILTRQGNNLRNTSDRILSDAGIIPKIVLETHSMDVCLQMAAYGLGATILPDSLYFFHSLRDRVRAFPLDSRYDREIAISYRQTRYLPFIMREFIKIATENLQTARQEVVI